MTGTARVIRANALDLPLPDASVDLVVTSPPYFGLRSYQDGGEHYAGQIGDEATPAEFVDALIAATREMVRVLKPSGSIWVNLGDKYARTGGGGGGSSDGKTGRNGTKKGSPSGLPAASPGGEESRKAGTSRDFQDRPYTAVGRPATVATGAPEKSLIGVPWRYALRCIDDLGLILRAEVIWSKPNGLPESVTDRVRRSHETWFHFTREPRYFSAVDEVREEHATLALADARGRNQRGFTGAPTNEGMAGNPLGKLPGSVWTIPTQPLRVPDHLGVDHFAAFPMEWPRRIIRGWSPAGGTVLDPFGGTGTTALVAKALGRDGISVDMSADYCRLAEWRTNDPGELARAMQVEKPPQQMPDQLDMFGGDAA